MLSTGIPSALPIDESHTTRPVNPYGKSKLFVERALDWYSKAYGLGYVCLRYFNAAGADPDGEIGECHEPETHLIPLAIRAALAPDAPLQIFGSDYDTPDGTAVRDYIHVSDLADAHVRALDHLSRGGKPGVINLGTGIGHSVREIQKGIEMVSGRSVPANIRDRRPGDPPILVASATKARSELGWNPRFTSLDLILSTAWNWQMKLAPRK